ncbi:hypothetical protein [Streptomyces sp. NPDC046805]|uniref:hypothetical protein n=1 Tax=Streptomyces sp. NPDC046805 TaxID=3155134 RepID=UPI0033EBE397
MTDPAPRGQRGVDLVAEFVADTSIDAGRYRHPVRFVRLRDDLTPQQTPLFIS